VCGKGVTIGVMHRVNALADRPQGSRPAEAFDFENIIPLAEILAEVHDCAATGTKATREYFRLLRHYGSELHILRSVQIETLERDGQHLLARALQKMRQGAVTVEPGYDGRYGVVRVFTPEEKRYNQPKLL